MGKKYDVTAITGTYTKDGQEKAKFRNVGSVIEKDGKFYLKLDTPIVVHDDGNVISWFNLYPPKPKQQPAQTPASPSGGDFDDDIPFIRIMNEYLI